MEISASLASLVIKVAGLIILGFALWTGRRTCADIMTNIDKFGTDPESKNNVATRALVNFWIGFAAVMIIVSRIFELIGNELFIGLLVADLTALGVKLTTEFVETRKLK